MRKLTLNPPPSKIEDFNHYSWPAWFESIYTRVQPGPFLIQGYIKTALPDPTQWGSVSADDPFSSIIFVYNEAGGPVMAFSDGTNWRRFTDNAIVS